MFERYICGFYVMEHVQKIEREKERESKSVGFFFVVCKIYMIVQLPAEKIQTL